MGDAECTYAGLYVVGVTEWKREYGRPICRLEGNIKLELKCNSIVSTGLFWLKIGSSCGFLTMLMKRRIS
jgi:hypothetical protein